MLKIFKKKDASAEADKAKIDRVRAAVKELQEAGRDAKRNGLTVWLKVGATCKFSFPEDVIFDEGYRNMRTNY